MLVTYLLVSLLPIIVFVLVRLKYDLKKAVIAAMLSMAVVLSYEYSILGEIEVMTLVEASFFLVMGIASWWFNRDYLFKLQPAIVNALLAFTIIAFQLAGKPLLVTAIEKLSKIDPRFGGLLNQTNILALMSALSWQLVILLVLHALLVWYTALRSRDYIYVLARASIFPGIFLIGLMNAVLFAN